MRNPKDFATGLESPYTPSRVPASVQEARDLVKLWIGAGADYVIMDDGSLPTEMAKAAFDEARKAGRPVFTLVKHNVIQVMVDAGLTPMQIIQGTTKWPAR